MPDEDVTSHPPHVELILQHIDALPTLSPIATRVLQLSGSSEAEVSEIVHLVESDPTLAARLLAMCRRSDKGLAHSVTTIERAVVLLGLEAVRAAMLSIQVFELLDADRGDSEEDDAPEGDDRPFDRRAVWLFSLGVASAAEMLAQRQAPNAPHHGEAFLCGLLHDLGKIAIDRIMPRSFASIARTCERRRAEFGEVAMRVIGVDHRTIGKRLSEHWGLPHAIQDCMWLTSQSPDHLPDVPHRRHIQFVIAGIGIARSLHLGWSGDFRSPPDLPPLLERCGVEPIEMEPFAEQLNDRVMERAAALGLMSESDPSLLLRAIGQANRELGRLSALLDRRARGNEAHTRMLLEISSFLESALGATSLPATLSLVASCAARALRSEVPGILWQHRDDAPCDLYEFDARGELVGAMVPEPIPGGRSLAGLMRAGGMGPAAWLSRVAAAMRRPIDSESLHVIPLNPETGAFGALLCRAPGAVQDGQAMEALTRSWTAAVAAAARHQGARRLGEQLATANNALLEAQAVLVESRADRRLAQVSAGAAHEMNNSLTVISGQAQGLLKANDLALVHPAARSIERAAGRLSELISALHFFANPPAPKTREASVERIVRDAIDAAVRRTRAEASKSRDARSDSTIIPIFEVGIPEVRVDPSQMSDAVTELVLNAIQSRPRGRVEVRVHADADDGRLIISVADDGVGMNEETLEHAFDPFFSERPAGRRTGLGLSKARRLVELNHGVIEIESVPDEGTTARIVLPGSVTSHASRAA